MLVRVVLAVVLGALAALAALAVLAALVRGRARSAGTGCAGAWWCASRIAANRDGEEGQSSFHLVPQLSPLHM